MVRKRFPEDVHSSDHPSNINDVQPSKHQASSSTKNTRLQGLYNRFDLESLLWIAVCAVMMYYTNFWPAIMYDLRVKRGYFYASISLFIVAIIIMIYCMMKMPTLNYSNWLQEGPMITPVLTIIVIIGSLW